MKTTPTAKELYGKMLYENDEVTSTEMMIEFAKLHVEAQAEAISEKIQTDILYQDEDGVLEEPVVYVNKESVLNAYPLTNIK